MNLSISICRYAPEDMVTRTERAYTHVLAHGHSYRERVLAEAVVAAEALELSAMVDSSTIDAFLSRLAMIAAIWPHECSIQEKDLVVRDARFAVGKIGYAQFFEEVIESAKKVRVRLLNQPTVSLSKAPEETKVVDEEVGHDR